MSRAAADRPLRLVAAPPRLRARRIAVDAERIGEVRATARHGELGSVAGAVRDLSLHGLALVLPRQRADVGLLLSGDRLEELRVTCADRVLFEGSGLVRRLGEDGGELVIGVELEGDGLDLAELHRQEARQGFAQRWQRLEDNLRFGQVQPAFKAFVADLRSFLVSTREFLAAEEKALAADDLLTREQATSQYLAEISPRLLAELDAARVRLTELVSGFAEEEHSIHRAYLKQHLAPLFAESPFMRRALEKPLGYAGDYEMMNMLYREHAEGETLFGKALNLYGTGEMAARANINRIEFLGAKIRELVAASPRARVRLASIGCGPAREIAALLERSPEIGPRLEVALLDQEPRSIAYCEKTLAPLARSTGARVQIIPESVRRLLTTRMLARTLGERDLVYSAGLFDYLGERGFGALLQVLWSAVVDGGRMAIGNVAAHNPSRWTMEYYSEWFLHHRSPEELSAQASRLDPLPAEAKVESEPTGVNLFLTLRK